MSEKIPSATQKRTVNLSMHFSDNAAVEVVCYNKKFQAFFFSLNFQKVKNDAYEDILKNLVEHQHASKRLQPKYTKKNCKKGYFLHK